MTLWDTLSGRKSSTPAISSTSPKATEFVPESDYSSSSPPSASTSSTPSSSSMAADFAIPTTSPGNFLPAFLSDPSLVNSLSDLAPDTLDYLKLEDTVLAQAAQQQVRSGLPARGFTDDLCYGAGCTYLAALSLGGAIGFAEGMRQVPASASSKLKLNAILNGVTRRGPFLGNSAGVIAIGYNCVNYSLGYMTGNTPLAKYDAARSVMAGGLTGMIFKSTRGTRPMLISGGLVAGAAALWQTTKRLLL